MSTGFCRKEFDWVYEGGRSLTSCGYSGGYEFVYRDFSWIYKDGVGMCIEGIDG